jgi:alpha-tubulin suppressor-like RCC1 family protein
MRTLQLIFGGLALGALSACTTATAYQCTDNSNCVDATGAQGMCEPSHVCSFLDMGCKESHRRLAGVTEGTPGSCVLAPPATSCVDKVAVGLDIICALRKGDGHVFCWGDNSHGTVGTGASAAIVESPTEVKLPGNQELVATELSAGEGHVCATLSSGEVWCWGKNNAGQLGDGTKNESRVPVKLISQSGGPAPKLSGLSVGGAHACAVGADQLAYCWGENQADGHGGQSGSDPAIFDDVLGARTILPGPPLPDGGPLRDPDGGLSLFDGVTTVQTGDTFGCLIKDDNSVWCWGVNVHGQLGNGTTTDTFWPVSAGLGAVQSIGILDQTACAEVEGSITECWGYNLPGTVGNGGTTDVLAPLKITGVSVDKLGQGGTAATNCFIDGTGGLKCFGDNSKNQSGTGLSSIDQPSITTPTPAKLITATSVVLGTDNGCAVTWDNGLWCWGENDSGQLGLGLNTKGESHPIPVRVPVPCP